MTPENFFRGRLIGFGCVQGFTGKVLRRYTVEVDGVWSEEHRALHVDERYTYVGQEQQPFQRSWVFHTDEEGSIIGYDALQAARFRGRQDGIDLRVVFDRPRRPGGPLEPRQLVRFVEVDPDHVMMVGCTVVFGITLATIQTALTRIG